MKPKNAGRPFRGGGRHDRSPHNVAQQQQKTKEMTWGQVKFNPFLARQAREEAATPWRKFKNELVQSNVNNEPGLSSAEAKEFMKRREQNYRRNLIEENRKQPTKWETFEDEPPGTSASNRNDNSGNHAVTMTNENMKFKQRNLLRKVITKTTILAKGKDTLARAVKQMKHEEMMNAKKQKLYGAKTETTSDRKKQTNSNNPFATNSMGNGRHKREK